MKREDAVQFHDLPFKWIHFLGRNISESNVPDEIQMRAFSFGKGMYPYLVLDDTSSKCWLLLVVLSLATAVGTGHVMADGPSFFCCESVLGNGK